MRPRSRPPLWFQLAVAVGVALLARAWAPTAAPPAGVGLDGAPLQLAFWPVVATIAGAIWTGIQAIGQATLQVLVWTVHYIWVFAVGTFNALKAVGAFVATAGRKVWDFVDATYTHVLKPAWEHLARWYKAFQRWLRDVVKPIYDWLAKIKKYILDLYTRYVRPVLDLIELTRRVAHVAAALGLDWARAIDNALGNLESAIDERFQWVIGQVNKVINTVNRIVTADGLFQRIALLGSIARDYREVWGILRTNYSRRVTYRDVQRHKDAAPNPTREEIVDATRDILVNGTGRYQPIVSEMSAQWETYLRAR